MRVLYFASWGVKASVSLFNELPFLADDGKYVAALLFIFKPVLKVM